MLAKLKNIIIFAVTIAAFTISFVSTVGAYELIQTEYEVQEGDTLDSIAYEFMALNTYGQRDITEFEEGIVDLNYDELIENDWELEPGMELRINYWTK